MKVYVVTSWPASFKDRFWATVANLDEAKELADVLANSFKDKAWFVYESEGKIGMVNGEPPVYTSEVVTSLKKGVYDLPIEERLQLFAIRTLSVMEDDEDWSSDTLEVISTAAHNVGLSKDSSHFRMSDEAKGLAIDLT